MDIVRRKKNKNYTILNNSIVNNKEIDCKTRGFYFTVMSLPDDWDFSIKGISSIIPDGRDAIYRIISNLIKYGYCNKKSIKDENNRFSKVEYLFCETPFDFEHEEPLTEEPLTENPLTGFPLTGFPLTGFPLTENPTQLNTNIINKLNNKILNEYNNENKIFETYFFKKLEENNVSCVALEKFSAIRAKNSNTEIAFNSFKSACEHHKLTIQEGVDICNEKEWQTIKKSYTIDYFPKELIDECLNFYYTKNKTYIKSEKEDKKGVELILKRFKESFIKNDIEAGSFNYFENFKRLCLKLDELDEFSKTNIFNTLLKIGYKYQDLANKLNSINTKTKYDLDEKNNTKNVNNLILNNVYIEMKDKYANFDPSDIECLEKYSDELNKMIEKYGV